MGVPVPSRTHSSAKPSRSTGSLVHHDSPHVGAAIGDGAGPLSGTVPRLALPPDPRSSDHLASILPGDAHQRGRELAGALSRCFDWAETQARAGAREVGNERDERKKESSVWAQLM